MLSTAIDNPILICMATLWAAWETRCVRSGMWGDVVVPRQPGVKFYEFSPQYSWWSSWLKFITLWSAPWPPAEIVKSPGSDDRIKAHAEIATGIQKGGGYNTHAPTSMYLIILARLYYLYSPKSRVSKNSKHLLFGPRYQIPSQNNYFGINFKI